MSAVAGGRFKSAIKLSKFAEWNVYGDTAFRKVVAHGLSRGYRYLTPNELGLVLLEPSSTPGYIAVPSSPYDCRVYEPCKGRAFQLTTLNAYRLEFERKAYSVLMAED